jgi:hypothetical protein
LGSKNGSKGSVEFVKNVLDCSLDKAGVFVDWVSQAVFVVGGIDLLDDGTLDLVASVKGHGWFSEGAMGLGDLCCRGLAEIQKDWEGGTNEWNSW